MTQEQEFAHPSPGWIPPHQREYLYEELTEEDMAAAREAISIGDDNGRMRPPTDDEIRSMVRRGAGVRNRATGEVVGQSSRLRMLHISLPRD